MNEQEKAFDEWWACEDDGSRDCEIASDGFKAGWLEACRRSAKAAWEAETHHNAVEAINKIANAIVFEP